MDLKRTGNALENQMLANLAKVRSFFPSGFLVEEHIGGSSRGGVSKKRKSKLGQAFPPTRELAPKPRSNRLSTIAWCWGKGDTVPSGDSSLEMEQDSARHSLYTLECEVATWLQGNEASDPAPWIAKLSHWCAEHIAEEGFVASDPWDAFRYWPALFRIRLALFRLDWPDDLEGVLGRIHAIVSRTGWSNGWLFHPGDGPSREFLRMLSEYRAPENPERWASARRSLWLGEKNGNKGVRGPEPGVQSDEARVSVLRQHWSPASAVLAVDHRSAEIVTELRVLDELVWTGPWRTEIRIGDRLLTPKGAWEATCWFQDSDGEYLELRQRGPQGVVLERQIFLARERPILWLSDTLRTESPAPLSLEWSFPVPSEVSLSGAVATSAQTLKGYPLVPRLLPIGQPANPLLPATGRVTVNAKGLTVSDAREGGRLFLPVVLTWAPRSLPLQQEWRRLTITNDRRVVPVDEAVAYRIPVGDCQMVFFRALREPIRYAFLGHQTYSECEIGHIDREGKFHEWLTVEGG